MVPRAGGGLLGHALYEGGPHLAADGRGLAVVELEYGLDDGELGGGGVLPGEGAPVVDDHAGPHHVRAPVDGARHQGNLSQKIYSTVFLYYAVCLYCKYAVHTMQI